jgi:hypothetical protein
VAIPDIIDPRTINIKNNGGTSDKKTLLANARSYFPSYGTDGAADGFKKAKTNM